MSVAIASDRWSVPDDVAPRRREEVSERPSTSTSGEGTVPSPTFRGRVLVVEDNLALRETLADILTGDGYGVETAEDGLVALDRMAHSSFDVVILDLAMPRLDGIELLARLEEPYPSVVIYSAFEYYTPEQVDQAAGAKIFRALRKPVPPDELVSVVAEAMASRGGPAPTAG